MPYIGRDLNRGNYLKIDDISSSFNSSTKTFNLTVGGSAFTPGSAFSILVSVGGVIQEPESAYQVNNDTITFANAPTAQDSFFCIALGVPIGIGVPGNGTVNGTQMAKPLNYDGFFFLNDASNRVGINSSIPTVALDVDGVIKASSFSGGIIGGGGINAGVGTFTGLDVNGNGDISGNLVLGGDLTVNGTTTTLDTNLIGVDRIEVGANSSTVVGVAITQSGTADILRLYDGTSQVVTVDDEGRVGIGSAIPAAKLDVSPTIQVKNTALNGVANVDINAANGGQARLNLYAGVSGGVNRAARIDFHNQGVAQWMLINDFSQNGTNQFSIRHDGEHAISCMPDGTVSLYDDGDESLRTDVAGILVPEKVIHLGDTNTYLQFTDDVINLTAGGTTGLSVQAASVRVPTKLGINGAAPQVPLDVIANGSGYAINVRGRSSDNVGEIRFTSNNYGSLYSVLQTGATYLNFQVGSTANALRIADTGNVSIKTSNTTEGVLQVNGDITAKLRHGSSDMYGMLAGRKFDGTSAMGGYAIRYASGYESPWIVGYNAGSSYDNQITFGSMTTSDRSLATGVQKRMVIDMASGKVGIGTDNPGAYLTVQSNSSNTNMDGHNYLASQSGIIIQNRTSSSGHFTAYTGNVASSGGYTQSGSLAFESTGSGTTPNIHITQRTGSGVQSKRLTINTSGDILIGKTSGDHILDINASSDEIRLSKASTSDYTGIQLDRDASGTAGGYFGLAGNTNHYITGSAQHDICLRSEANLVFSAGGATERLRISSTGEVKINGDGSGTGYLRVVKDRDTAYSSSGGNNQDLIIQQISNATNTGGYSSLALQCNYTGQTGAWVAINAVRTAVGEADLTINPRNNTTGDVEKVRITSGGDVGIGTDSPSYKLQVHHTNPGGLLRLLSSHEGNYDLRFVYQNGETNIWSYGSTDVTFGTRYNKKLHLVTNGPSKRLTINGDLIGINETDPAKLLTIVKNSTASYNSSALGGTDNHIVRIHNKNGTDNTGVNNHTGLEFIVSNGANSVGQIGLVRTGNNVGDMFFKFRTAASSYAERFRIHNNGKLEASQALTSSVASVFKIGDTLGSFNFEMSEGSGGTDFINHVKRRFVSKNTYGLTITSRSTLGGSYTKAGEASIKFYYPSAGGGNQAGGQLEFWTNQNGYAGTTEAKRMQIDNGGNIGAPTGNNIYNASDERLKENMVELTNGLDKIKKLKPISFNWKDGWVESLSGKKEYGFGAQTTQAVDAMLVEPFGTDDALLNGQVIKDPLRVNEKYIVPLLVKAIQEQQEQIETLKTEISALKSS